MTCKEALAARYTVKGKHSSGVIEHGIALSFHEALRYYNSLIEQGCEVTVRPLQSRMDSNSTGRDVSSGLTTNHKVVGGGC